MQAAFLRLVPFSSLIAFLLGVALVAAGAAMIFWPAGLIVAGAGLAALFYEPRPKAEP